MNKTINIFTTKFVLCKIKMKPSQGEGPYDDKGVSIGIHTATENGVVVVEEAGLAMTGS